MNSASPCSRLPRRLLLSSIHLLIGVVVLAGVAVLVLALWFPPPFDRMSGGRNLLLLIAGVDVVLGPFLTGLVASPAKSPTQVGRDIAVIVVVQICALAYGLHVLVDARPAWVSYERLQFRVLAAGDIEEATLAAAPATLQGIPWDGPRLISAVMPSNPDEQFRAIQDGLAGFDLSYFPRNWRSYESQASRAWAAARPAAELIARDPSKQAQAQALARSAGQSLARLRYLPVKTKDGHWSVLLGGPSANVVGYLPIDGEE